MANGKRITILTVFFGFLFVISSGDGNPFSEAANFFTPFDTWRKSFPAPSDGSVQFWPNFHDFGPDFRNSELGPFSSEERTEGPNREGGSQETFDIETITSDVPHNTNFFLQHSFPFFNGDPLFSTFGGFGFTRRREPWWKGPNVCTDREETTEEPENKKAATGGESAEEPNDSDVENLQRPYFFHGLQISVNSCVEKPHKYVCKRVFNQNGVKKTVTVTRQCCHGYGRPRNADGTTSCEKIDIKSIVETSEEMGAKEFIRSAKNNGLEEKLLSNITLFLPTDAAFTEFSEQMFENNLVVLPLSRRRRRIEKRETSPKNEVSGITTKELALNHMVDGWINMEDIRNEQLLPTNFENSSIRINVYPRPPNNNRYEYPYRYTANCAPIIKLNRLATNGIVHVVDRVLTPVTENLMDIVKQRSDMAVFRTILEKTKLNELLEADKPITVFAPTDKAFEKLDMHLRRTLKEGKGCATNILKNHILDLSFCSVAVISDGKTTAYNLLGEPMIFERANPNNNNKSNNDSDEGKQIMQEMEIADMTGIQNILINGQAKIIESDIMGTNGVLHVVDTIMPTDTALPVTSLLEKKNLTIFKRLVELSGNDNEFDDLNNATIFAPIDKAFDGSEWKRLLEEEPDSLKDNQDLKDFLGYHVIEPMTKTCDLSEKIVKTKSGSDARVNLYSTHAVFTNVMNRATVNCARLIHFDDESCGSVLHQVDKLLTPPKSNLLHVLEENPDYSMFLDLIKIANLTSLLEDNNQSFTLLVPKNDIFQEMEDWLKRTSENRNELEHLIKTHIINDVVCCAGIIPTNWPFVRTIETIDNSHLRISRDRRPKIEQAGITKCDIVATNGILHEINDVINVKRVNPNHHQHIDSFDDLFFKK